MSNVQDRKTAGVFDGVDSNGVFDIVVSAKGIDDKEVKTPLGTVRSSESFNLAIDVNHGAANVEVVTAAKGRRSLSHFALFDPGKKIYFKFGDYLQAWDLATGAHTTDARRWIEYYKAHHFDSERVAFDQVRYWRE